MTAAHKATLMQATPLADQPPRRPVYAPLLGIGTAKIVPGTPAFPYGIQVPSPIGLLQVREEFQPE